MGGIALEGYVTKPVMEKVTDYFFLLADYEVYGVLCDPILTQAGIDEIDCVLELEFVMVFNKSPECNHKIGLILNAEQDVVNIEQDGCVVQLKFNTRDLK
jgi:hypothetical protein